MGGLLWLAGCAGAPTWSEDVRPIVQERCVDCHTDGTSAPFTLHTAEEAAPWAAAMAAAVEEGRMPPWSAAADCAPLRDDPRLTEAEQATLRAWADAGAPAGPEVAPLVARSHDLDGAEAWPIPAVYTPSFDEGADDYRCFLLDRAFDEETFVTATQVLPGSAAVHHALVFNLTAPQVPVAERLDAEDPGTGYRCFGGPLSSGETVSLLDQEGGVPEVMALWVPGNAPSRPPPGAARQVDPGGRIVVQLHYADLGVAEPDQTVIQAVTTSTPPERVVRSRPVIDTSLRIPAGDPAFAVERTVTNRTGAPATLTAVFPHMHLLGKEARAELEVPDAHGTCVVDVPRWDFHWQRTYAMPDDAPRVIAPGDALTVSCVWDNSAEGQPVVDGAQDAPRDVTWGEDTDDEMCLFYLDVIEPYAPAPAADAPQCAGTEACVAACGDAPSWDCLVDCEAASLDCLVCGLQVSEACAFADCTLPTLAAAPCLRGCVADVLAFGGSLGACLDAVCPDAWSTLLACADVGLASGACDEGLQACGVSFSP